MLAMMLQLSKLHLIKKQKIRRLLKISWKQLKKNKIQLTKILELQRQTLIIKLNYRKMLKEM